jgi:RNA polymerase sigma-70 factor, ECF subfamily
MAVLSPAQVFNDDTVAFIQFKARQLCRKPGFTRSDEDDLRQELTLHLLRQASRFDPARAAWNTFVARVIDSGVAMILRDRRRKKRAPGFRAKSLEVGVVVVHGHEQDVGAIASAADQHRRIGITPTEELPRQQLSEAVRQAISELPPHLRALCARLSQSPPAVVARELGISRRQVRKLMSQIRQRLQDADLENR